MLTVKILRDDELIEELQILMVGSGLQGIGGQTGACDYLLIKPKHEDMPAISHIPADGDLILAAKMLTTFIHVSANKPADNLIKFPIKDGGGSEED